MGNSVIVSSNMTDTTIDDILSFSQGMQISHHYIRFMPTSNLITFFSPSKEAYLTMLASENVLKKEWDDSVEDEAWADL